MFAPDILRMLTFIRHQQQARLLDACTDTAQFYGVDPLALRTFALSLGV